MNKKLLVRYILLFLPFCLGCVLFSFSVINVFSSMLFFVGGYVGIKNLCDYRLIRKNVEKANENILKEQKKDNYEVNVNRISGIRRVRQYKRVRTKK